MRKTHRQIFFTLTLSLGLTSWAQADTLGRLFFTPAERTQLEQQQARKTLNEDGSTAQSVITVNGMIKRDDGSRIAWVNGKAQRLEASPHSNSVPVTVPGKSKPVEVKVGQRLVLDNPAPISGTANLKEK